MTPEQQRLRDVVVEFARTELSDDVARRDLAAEFPRELWRRCAGFGVLGWAVPEAHGGRGLPPGAVVPLMEALGYGCRDNGLTFALGAQMWSVQTALLHAGSEHQIERYLRPAVEGRAIAAFAMSESGSGSDAFAIATTATPEGDGYVLDGEKVLVTLAPIADYAVVFAATDPAAGRWGLSAFLVDADTPGFTAHPNEHKMGLRTVPFGRITLDGCRVPGEALLGRAGAGASLFSHSQGWERSLVLAPQVGAMEHLVERCVEFARTRRRAGQPIGKHQAVSHRIADMRIRLEASRLMLRRTAAVLEAGGSALLEAAMTKTYLSEAFVASSHDAIAVHGGDGYTSDAGVERNLRDAIGATLYGGTVDIQRNIVAGLLGL